MEEIQRGEEKRKMKEEVMRRGEGEMRMREG